MNLLTAGSQALLAALVGTLVLCWFVLAFMEWLAFTFKSVFRG